MKVQRFGHRELRERRERISALVSGPSVAERFFDA